MSRSLSGGSRAEAWRREIALAVKEVVCQGEAKLRCLGPEYETVRGVFKCKACGCETPSGVGIWEEEA